ncbi:MAG TPA: hypothetical protein DEA08_11555 [Planctomycetes bacterium]|nr:hypothetical protein [Planctomycetota bacterium]|tara:strand:- start:12 stop:755 length:744 start_codon:yes stop_codon:yes gene_type:complete
MTTKLNQVLAIEKSTKSRVHGEITRMHHSLQKAGLLNGFAKSYQPKDEDGDHYPPERQRVQVNAASELRRAGRLLGELFDVTATKDWANTQATADLVIDGETLLEQVPATYLLFLEKQLNDLRTFVDKIPVLDQSEEWTYDEQSALFKTEPTQTTRTKKVQRPIVLYPATPEHPAQTQLISEDVAVGNWITVKHSGAIPAPRKAELLERIERLAQATKFAREKANASDAPRREVGERLFRFLLGNQP